MTTTMIVCPVSVTATAELSPMRESALLVERVKGKQLQTLSRG